ncbi:MAG: glutathione S-transferase [Rhodospirillales bacterium CG15_BIG_FIL_POST_REV_8_21_14_020_66_15]|nr:MAG: glutathione S-transferase [Rhodospirillales bacterium CG15_BIG_FIL_POST_REV_8_21_14_020_66_15]
MIDLYTWGTPNGRKASIMLEEVGLEYNVIEINISKGEQHSPAFLEISPNNRIPAIVDPDGPDGKPISVFETGAILIYLAEKTGSELLPRSGRERVATFEWLMWQMGGVGPMFGQAHHFLFQPKEVVPYGQKRYHDETKRLYMVMNDRRLHKNEYLAGGFYSIADIAVYPWVARHERHQVDLNEFPNVKRWFDTISARDAVKKGMAVPFTN